VIERYPIWELKKEKTRKPEILTTGVHLELREGTNDA